MASLPPNVEMGTPGAGSEPTAAQPGMKERAAMAQAKKDLLDDITKDFQRLQQQKAREQNGVEARILLAKAFDWGEQYIAQAKGKGLVISPQDENKLYLVFNTIAQHKQKLVGRLYSTGLQFGAQPSKDDPKSMGEAEVVDKLILGLDKLLDQPTKTWQLLDELVTAGTVYEYTPWIPNAKITAMPQFAADGKTLMFKDTWTNEIIPQPARDMAVQGGEPQERFEIYEIPQLAGEVGSEILSALNVFIDQTVKSIEDLAPDQRVHIARMKTRGWIEDYATSIAEITGEDINLDDLAWDKDLKIVTTTLIQDGDSVSSLFLKDMIPSVQGTTAENDPDMAIFVESYLPPSQKNPHGRMTCYIPGKMILYDAPCPYDEIPLTDIHFTAVTTTHWTKDYITDQIAPQRFLNKRMSQLGEQSNASIYAKTLLGPGLSQDDFAADQNQYVKDGLNEQGQPMAAQLPPPTLPGWFLESLKLVMSLGEGIAGGKSLTEDSKFPGQLRGPMAVPMLQELMDSEWGPLYFHLAHRMARIKQQRLNRVKKYYPSQRTLHYTDKNMRDEVLDFHADILRSGVDFNISVEQTSVIPELRALREARVKERLQGPLAILYMDERTGHIDKSKVAKDLRMGDYGREDRESATRKFAMELIARLKQGKPCPPVEQFWDHEHMMDELEGEMMTTEFLSSSQQVQQLMRDRWQQHLKFLTQKAQMQQQAMQSHMVMGAVSQATQQVAAQTAAETVDAVMQQQVASMTTQPGPEQMVATAVGNKLQGQPATGPINPSMKPPMPPKAPTGMNPRPAGHNPPGRPRGVTRKPPAGEM